MKASNFKFVLTIILPILLSSSCGNEPQFDESKLHGEWKVVNWEVLSTGKTRSNKMDFSFQPDGRYTVDYGSENENGKYWIAKDDLYTVEDNQAEKTVKIFTLNKDTLSFQMNRAGELENVVLVKK